MIAATGFEGLRFFTTPWTILISAALVVAVTVAASVSKLVPTSRGLASPLRFPGFLICATRAMASFALVGTCPPETMSMSRSNKLVSSLFVVAMSSPEPVDQRPETKRTRRFCASTPLMVAHRTKHVIAVDSTISRRCSPTSDLRFRRVTSRTT